MSLGGFLGPFSSADPQLPLCLLHPDPRFRVGSVARLSRFGHSLNVCFWVAAAGSPCCPDYVEIGLLVTLISPPPRKVVVGGGQIKFCLESLAA